MEQQEWPLCEGQAVLVWAGDGRLGVVSCCVGAGGARYDIGLPLLWSGRSASKSEEGAVRRSGAQMVWDSFVREGVEVIFGIPGGAVIPLYHALPDYPIRHVLMRHEQAAIHAAHGYACASGRTGACIVTSGPGATNLVTGLATARAAAAPLVVITGQAPSAVLGTDAFQEVDIATITEPVTKHNYLITAIDELPMAIREAFYLAGTGRPGPVLVVMTNDVQRGESAYAYPEEVDLPGYDPSPQQGGDPVLEPAGDVELGWIEDEGSAGSEDLFEAVVQRIAGGRRWAMMLVADSGLPAESLARHGAVTGALGAAGFALPAAIGAQIALPDHEVWVVASDQTFQATCQELATVSQEALPLRIAVVRAGQPSDEDDKGALLWRAPPDFAMLAAAYGIPGIVVREKGELEGAIAEVASTAGPIVIDVRVEAVDEMEG